MNASGSPLDLKVGDLVEIKTDKEPTLDVVLDVRRPYANRYHLITWTEILGTKKRCPRFSQLKLVTDFDEAEG